MNSWIPTMPKGTLPSSSLPDPFLRLERISSLGKYDVLKLTKEEMHSIADTVADMDGGERARYMLNPALQYFTVVEDFGEGTERIDFVPPADGVMKRGSMTMTPCVVACWENPNEKGATGLGIMLAVVDDAKTRDSLTISRFCFIHNDYLGINRNESQPIVRSLREFYIGVQKALYERPALFKERTEKCIMPNSHRHKRGKKQKTRKVKAYRVITIDSEQWVQSMAHGAKRVITCPNYGVIGHWRHYKSGKCVWIAPYRKGKNRHIESAYSAKEYQIVQEVRDA